MTSSYALIFLSPKQDRNLICYYEFKDGATYLKPPEELGELYGLDEIDPQVILFAELTNDSINEDLMVAKAFEIEINNSLGDPAAMFLQAHASADSIQDVANELFNACMMCFKQGNLH